MEVEKGINTKAAIARLFRIPATTLSTWIKSSELIKDAYIRYGPSRKTLKTATYEDVEIATLNWFIGARNDNIPISGPVLCAKAEELASQLDIESFKASTGWLDRFKERNDIKFKKVCAKGTLVHKFEKTDEWDD